MIANLSNSNKFLFLILLLLFSAYSYAIENNCIVTVEKSEDSLHAKNEVPISTKTNQSKKLKKTKYNSDSLGIFKLLIPHTK